MLRLAIVSLMILAAVFTAGCFGGQETDDIAYVLVMGLDKSKQEGKLDVTYQMAIPRALTGEGASGEPALSITLTAESTSEARDLFNSVVARTLNLSHTKVLIIGESLARQGLGEVLGVFMRFREFRGGMKIIIVNDDTAQNFISKNKPKMELVVSRYYETILLSADQSSYFPSVNLHDFYSRMKSGSAAPIAVLAGISGKDSEQASSIPKKPSDSVDDYLAGQIPRGEEETDKEKPNLAEFLGTAVFREDKLVGKLTNQETRMMAILRNNLQNPFFTIDDPLVAGKHIVLNLRLGRNTKLDADIQNDQAKLTAEIFLEGEISALTSGVSYERKDYRKLLEEHISQTIKQDILTMLHKTQGMRADVVGFGYPARKNFRTYNEFMQIDWADLYSKADIDVTVKTRIRRTGLMWKTSPINGSDN